MATQNSIDNTSNPLASTAVTIDPGASGDSYVQFDINTTGEFRFGVDDDASDALKLSQGSALGTNDTWIMSSAGERTMPLQPCFLVSQTSDQSNVTGAGTDYTVTFSNEIFDQNSDFDGTSTFTAPVTGRYQLCWSLYLQGTTSAMTNNLTFLVTSNATYRPRQWSFAAGQDVSGAYVINGYVIADMDASDTAVVHIRCINGAGDTVDVIGSTALGFRSPWFGGFLMC